MIASIAISRVMHGEEGIIASMLDVHRFPIIGHHLFWSWPVFCFATAIAWACFKVTDGD
jgi:hypothetical protein